MEVNLKREAIQYCTPVYSDTLNREETLETVVSDTLPDIARILDVDAAVYLLRMCAYRRRRQSCSIHGRFSFAPGSAPRQPFIAA